MGTAIGFDWHMDQLQRSCAHWPQRVPDRISGDDYDQLLQRSCGSPAAESRRSRCSSVSRCRTELRFAGRREFAVTVRIYVADQELQQSCGSLASERSMFRSPLDHLIGFELQ
jgi:hypothetical protein